MSTKDKISFRDHEKEIYKDVAQSVKHHPVAEASQEAERQGSAVKAGSSKVGHRKGILLRRKKFNIEM